MNSFLKRRFAALAWHFFASCVIATFSAALVFFIWYPGLLAYGSGVSQIYGLLLIVDVVLGPCITLLIFDTKNKKSTELRRDIGIIALIQSSALIYGMFVFYQARPIYIVYSVGRFDVVYANEISEEKYSKTPDAFKSLPLSGPKLVAAKMPSDPTLKSQILFSALGGKGDLPTFTQYYVNYDSEKIQAGQSAEPINRLYLYNKFNRSAVAEVEKKYKATNSKVGFIAVKAKANNFSAIVDVESGKIFEYVDLRPW